MLDRQKFKSSHELPYLRNINVRWNTINTNDIFKMFFRDHELERFNVRQGDVLVCEGGEPGRAAVWKSPDSEMKYQKALHRVHFFSGYNPKSLVFSLEYLAKTGKLEYWFTGSTIKHFMRESFSTLTLSIPPLAEQLQIISEIERRLSIADEIEQQINTNLKRAERMRQSILKKAFSGRLVPQDPNDEPAGVLLEKVKQGQSV